MAGCRLVNDRLLPDAAAQGLVTPPMLRSSPPSGRWRGFCSGAADFVVSRGAVFVLGIFAAVGFFVLDDYGVSGDEYFQRLIGHRIHVHRC